MKVIIAGSRQIEDYDIVVRAVQASEFHVTEVVSGMARGVDRLGLKYAKHYNLSAKHVPADWQKHGKAAGFIRNVEMAEYADALIAVWDGKSHGTAHMIAEARKRGLKVFVFSAEKTFPFRRELTVVEE